MYLTVYSLSHTEKKMATIYVTVVWLPSNSQFSKELRIFNIVLSKGCYLVYSACSDGFT